MVERPEHAGNDSEQTKDHKTGHHQPIPSADVSHVTSSPLAA
jgi:hypothetical protein